MRGWLAALAPGLVAAIAVAIGFAIDDQAALIQQVQAMLFSGARLALAAWPVWALAGAVRTRKWRRHVSLGVLGGVLGGVPFGSWLGLGDITGLRVASTNLDAFATEGADLEDALGAVDADVLWTIERRAEAIPGMRRVADNFDRDLQKPSWGLAAFCREGLTCRAWIADLVGHPSCPMPMGTVTVDDLCILSLHLPPPVTVCNEGRDDYMEVVDDVLWGGRIARDVGTCTKGQRALVIGDLNSTPGMWIHRDLVARGFRDLFKWHGAWASTWPAGGGYPKLPITQLDHAFAGETVAIEGVETFAIPGSDHRGLLVGVAD